MNETSSQALRAAAFSILDGIGKLNTAVGQVLLNPDNSENRRRFIEDAEAFMRNLTRQINLVGSTHQRIEMGLDDPFDAPADTEPLKKGDHYVDTHGQVFHVYASGKKRTIVERVVVVGNTYGLNQDHRITRPTEAIHREFERRCRAKIPKDKVIPVILAIRERRDQCQTTSRFLTPRDVSLAVATALA